MTLPRYWQDEAIASILLGDNPHEFLESLKNELFLHDGELLKRFCFVLEMACQISYDNKEIISQSEHHVILLFKPYGRGWQALIDFLFHHRERLSESLLPHITTVLTVWASATLNTDEELPSSSREAGLLALQLLHPLKDSYEDGEVRTKLLSIILKTVSVIPDEFISLLETDVFISKTSQRQTRLHYVDEFCKMLFSRLESGFLCKYHPDMLIRLAHFEWFIQESSNNEDSWHHRVEVEECFGLHKYKYDFFPASGGKGPFQSLLYYHQNKGIDFILEILNKAADNYAHSNLDHPTRYQHLRVGALEPLVEKVEIQLNDGTIVKQYCSGRLWLAYRGHSVVPYLLQCALMALENCLITYVELSESNRLEGWFNYILRNSNSVMPTAALASVATGFHQKVGKFALPLLRIPKLYLIDLHRTIHERGEHETDYLSIQFQRDILSELYSRERKTAALRPWRKENLENLVVHLQFSEWRNEALAAIDAMRVSAISNDNAVRFLLHRIDSREWNPVVDEQNNRILFEPKDLEPDLVEIQQRSQKDLQGLNRFAKLCLWTKYISSGKPSEDKYYSTWNEALTDAKELFEEIKIRTIESEISIYYEYIVTAATGFIQSHSHELTTEDISWCCEVIVDTIISDMGSEYGSDHRGVAAAASALPMLLDFTDADNERQGVKAIIAIALMHVNQDVRNKAAEGIRLHLWQRDEQFAQNCIAGTIAYARFKRDTHEETQYPAFWEKEKEEKLLKLQEAQQAKKENFCEQLALGKFVTSDSDTITFQTHQPNYLLAPCLMIPHNSTKSEHIALFSQMLKLFFSLEQQKNTTHSEREQSLQINPEITLKFTRHFASCLFHSSSSSFQYYIEQLRIGCKVAPNFMHYLLLCIAVESEKENTIAIYWRLCRALSQAVQQVALKEVNPRDHDSRQQHDELIRGILKADLNYRNIDLENQDYNYISHGKEFILEFVENTGEIQSYLEHLQTSFIIFPQFSLS
ncbi:MAG: hypothetical protein R3E08_12990 [Thiotrichaceae bacterium]